MDSSSEIIARMQGEMSKTKNKRFTMVTNTFIQSGDYSVYEKLVYINLKSHCFDTNISWPSINTLAANVPCCRNTVISALKKLRDKGDIEKIDGDHRSTTHKLKRGPFYQPERFIK